MTCPRSQSGSHPRGHRAAGISQGHGAPAVSSRFHLIRVGVRRAGSDCGADFTLCGEQSGPPCLTFQHQRANPTQCAGPAAGPLGPDTLRSGAKCYHSGLMESSPQERRQETTPKPVQMSALGIGAQGKRPQASAPGSLPLCGVHPRWLGGMSIGPRRSASHPPPSFL